MPPLDLFPDLGFHSDALAALHGSSQSLTPGGSHGSRSSAVGGLILPSSPSDNIQGAFRLEGDDGPGSLGDLRRLNTDVDMLDIAEADFTFGEDGELIDLMASRAAAHTPMREALGPVNGNEKSNVIVRGEYDEGQHAVDLVSNHPFIVLCTILSPRRLLAMRPTLALSLRQSYVSQRPQDF